MANKKTKKVEKVKLTKEQKAVRKFGVEYNELCEKHGLELGAAPMLVFNQNDGTYSIKIQINAQRFSKSEE